MSNKVSSVKVIIVVWFSALLMNTLFGTAFLTSLFTDAEMVGAYALAGFVFATIFSIPLAAVLFLSLRLLVRMEITGRSLFLCFFMVGNLLTAASFMIFCFTMIASVLPLWWLFVIALTSGSISMLIEYRAIMQLRKQDDETPYESFLND